VLELARRPLPKQRRLTERYLENSPLFFLNRVETPLLLIHGSLDRAVPPTQSEAVFGGLRRLGKPVVYVRYEGEEHWQGTWGYANVADYWQHVIAWSDRYLKGDGVGSAAR
jgi:dipeptidyl aminopeptidase/acylaminoacyl peptidase